MKQEQKNPERLIKLVSKKENSVAKVENKDDGYRAGVEFGSIHYETKAVRLPWEITEIRLSDRILKERALRQP